MKFIPQSVQTCSALLGFYLEIIHLLFFKLTSELFAGDTIIDYLANTSLGSYYPQATLSPGAGPSRDGVVPGVW